MAQNRYYDIPDDDAYEEEDTLKDRYLAFRVDDDVYAIEVRHVTVIVPLQPITEVPDMPAYVRGVMNLRGRVIPVLDVRRRFRLPDIELDERTCVIVTDLAEGGLGLLVDRVEDVETLPEGEIAPPPPLASGAASACVAGLGRHADEVRILLDARKLVFGDDWPTVSAAVATATPHEDTP